MKFLEGKNGTVGVLIVALLAVVFAGLLAMPAAAEWITVSWWEDEGSYYDTTNGVYVLVGHFATKELWVEPEAIEERSTEEPIDTTTGNNYFTESRIFVPCPGLPLEVGLKYQSVTSKPAGLLGKGWHHSFEWTLDDQATNMLVYTASGSKIIFEQGTNGLYLSSTGNNWTLTANGTGHEVGLPNGMIYSFNTNGLLDVVQDAWGNWLECSYGTNDCLETAAHANGRNLVFSNSWDAVLEEWRVESIQVEGGMSLAFDYNADGQFTQVVEQVGVNNYTSSYQYADGYLTNKVNGAGFEYTFEYETDGGGLLSGKGTYLAVDGYYEHEVDYADYENHTDVTYHRRGTNQIFRYSRNRGILETKYGPAGSVQDIDQRGVQYTYSTNGVDITDETFFDDTLGETWTKRMLYDDAHNLTNFSIAYESTNLVQLLSMEYDPVWQLPSAIMDADDLHTEIIYTNDLPLVVKAFHSETNSYDTHLSYTTNGLLKAITNANGHGVEFGYDSMGNLSAASAEVGPSITNTYDTLGFTQSTELLSEGGVSTGRTTQYGRNAKGLVEQVVFADGWTNSYTYNALGYLTNRVDRAGRTTDYTYAPTRKLTSITRWLEQDGGNVPVRIGYDLDKQMNLLSITEPRDRYVESYQLDIQDRVTSVTNIESQVLSIDYGIGDFVKQVTRFDGSTLTHTYDTAGRKATTTFNVGTTNAVSMAFDYYPDSMLKGVGDGASTISNHYDRLNQLDRTTSYSSAVTYQAAYSHDPVGNVTGSFAAYNAPGSLIQINTGYTYDEAERLETRGIHAFGYNPNNGRIASVSNTVDGITTAYAYDLMDRVTNIVYRTSNGSLIRSLEYAYDASSMITNKAIVDDASSFVTHAYEYDSINRLVGESKSNSLTSASSAVKYSYDLAGNRLSKTTSENTAIVYTLGTGNRLDSWKTTFATDLQGTSSELIGTDNRWGALWVSNLNAKVGAVPQTAGTDFWVDDLPLEPGTNQLVAALRDQAGNMDYTTNTVHLVATSTNMQYSYNAAGCLTNVNGVSLDWDERYRLTSAVRDSVFDIQYSYDVLGRKASRTVNGNSEHYLYEGNHVLADLYDNLRPHRVYAYGPSATGAGVIGIDNILTMTTYLNQQTPVGTTYHYLKDHQNSVIALTDSNGTVVESYEYDAYGNTKVFDASGTELTTSAYGNHYGFQGREIDWDTGLYYFRARWYNPEIGRWLSKDPIGVSGGLNQYVAFGNNPVNFVDPNGEDFKTWLKGAVVATQLSVQVFMQEAGPKAVRMASKGKAVTTQIVKKVGSTGVAGIGGIFTLVMTPTTANAGEAEWIFRQQMAEEGWVEGEDGLFRPPETPECR